MHLITIFNNYRFQVKLIVQTFLLYKDKIRSLFLKYQIEKYLISTWEQFKKWKGFYCKFQKFVLQKYGVLKIYLKI